MIASYLQGLSLHYNIWGTFVNYCQFRILKRSFSLATVFVPKTMELLRSLENVRNLSCDIEYRPGKYVTLAIEPRFRD